MNAQPPAAQYWQRTAFITKPEIRCSVQTILILLVQPLTKDMFFSPVRVRAGVLKRLAILRKEVFLSIFGVKNFDLEESEETCLHKRPAPNFRVL